MKFKLNPIYAVSSISSFAGSMVGIFVPVYLLTLNYSLHQVMFLFLLEGLFTFVFSMSTGYLSAKVPLKSLMLVRIPILIAFLALLIQAKHEPISLGLLALLQGAQLGLYYVPLHVFFAVRTKNDTIGQQVGLFYGVPSFLSIGAPLISGFIAAKWGFNPVFGIAAVLFAVSTIPLANVEPYRATLRFDLAKFVELFKQYQRYFWLEIVENVQEELDQVIWPLAVFLIVRNTIQVGLVGTLLGAMSAIFTYVIGRQSDRMSKFTLLRIGALVMLSLWVWRLQPLTSLSIVIISAIVGFASVLITVPFGAIIYNLARENNAREFIMFREVPVFVARALVYTIAFVFVTDIRQLFWLAIVAYALFAIMPKLNTTSPLAQKTAV